MTRKELESQALKLAAKARARLASKLLESLENLSEEENLALWAEEAQRRDEAMDRGADGGKPAEMVFRDAESGLR